MTGKLIKCYTSIECWGHLHRFLLALLGVISKVQCILCMIVERLYSKTVQATFKPTQ